ncbi:MAG: WD40/YVTN/BNR-like repeat-containing protein, partial [Emticicia sp.]|uniref:WD40/YVTN/BNR-like repeat-containing protein n=1 Tax=Emticicia sp. TaxID=1930953 RepID=UPI003BA559A6
MKNNRILYAILLLVSFLANAQRAKQEKEDPEARARFEYNMTKDPKTGTIPRDELEKARNIMSKMIKLMAPVPNVTWAERGPNTVGGRTRALMWDPNDATKKKVWAGGVSGGLWYNNDITDVNTSWVKVDDFWDNIAIGTIAYDPSNTQVMYVGTGERSSSGNVGNSGESGTGGGGIWKTTNGGTTWARLASTIPDYVNSNDAAGWRTVEKIVVNAQGHVYAVNYWGVIRSTDGGATWATLTGTNAPPTENPNRITDIELGTDGILYVGEGGGFAPKIYKSTDANITAFTLITPTHTATKGRVDMVLAPNTSGANQTLYVIAASSDAQGVRFFKKSVDAGANWTDVVVPLDVSSNANPKPPFTGKQADYNLILGIKPTDVNTIYAGGTTVGISYTGGTGNPAWKHELGSNYFYPPVNKFFVDNHAFAARPGFPNEAVFGNDGGVFYSADWGDPNVTEPNFQRRTKGYNVTQFYSVAIAGAANSGLIMGGAQDNGTQIVNSTYGTQGSGFEIRGGDGGLNYIDQEDVNLLISSYTNVTYQIHPSGPANTASIDLTPTSGSRGEFINQSDYDSPNNTLYVNYYLAGEPNQAQIIRYTISGTAPNYTSVSSILTLNTDIKPSVIKLGKTAGSLFLGTSDGKVYKATGIPATGDQNVALTLIMDNANTSTGYVSSIDFGTTENTIVVAKSNYNIKSVFYTTDGGTNWTSKDETGHGLPNVPIRYVLVNPVDTKQVLLATELGVWSTSDITAANPQWAPTNAALANVRCDMLRFRASDNTVAVATHGRGFFTTKINQNGTPCPTTLVLISTADDKTTGTTNFQAAETITASNKITGNANVTMKAGKSVELKPSNSGGGTTFEAANGTVFQAFIQGCSN